MRLRALLPALALLPLAACGGSSDPGAVADEGWAALNSGDHAKAAALFDQALAAMPPTDARHLEVELGALRARAYGDAASAEEKPEAAAAAQAFLQLAGSQKVDAADYRLLVTDLTTARAYVPAVDVLKAGKAAYPDDGRWEALIKKVGDAAQAAGAADAMAGLKGLGYIGE